MAICYWWDTSPDLKYTVYCLHRLKIQPAEHCTFSRTLALSSVFCSRFFVWLVALSRMAWEEKNTGYRFALLHFHFSWKGFTLEVSHSFWHFVFEMQEQKSIEIIHSSIITSVKDKWNVIYSYHRPQGCVVTCRPLTSLTHSIVLIAH